MSQYLEGEMLYKGERGYSAYEIAVQHGYVGSEEAWLATLGKTSHFAHDITLYTSTENQKEFDLPSEYTSNSLINIYVNGFKLNQNEYTIDVNAKTIILSNALDAGGLVEITILTVSTNDRSIVETIDENSTNDEIPSAKAVYDYVQSMLEQ